MDAREQLEQMTKDDIQSYNMSEYDDVKLTEKAAKHLLSIDHPIIEMSAEGGGCSGMSYQMKPLPKSFIKSKTDKVFESYGVKVVVPFSSYVYMMGLEIDYKDDLLNGGFKFNNPQAERSCGCGTSFSV
jgi:iron-sulfur cluster assembly accessory protein